MLTNKLTIMKDLLISTLVGLGFAGMLIIYLFAIIDLHKRNFKTLSEKGKWLAIIWLLPLLGSAYYLLEGRRKDMR